MAKTLGGGKTVGGRGKTRSLPYVNPASDPLAGVPETGDLEKDSKAELGALGEAFKARRKAEDKRYAHAVDGSYWLGVVFQSRHDREAFLQALKMDQRVFRGQYLDGYELAQVLGLGDIFDKESGVDAEPKP